MPDSKARGTPLDHDVLHQLLFRRADRLGRLKLEVHKLAAELDRNYPHMTLVVHDMVDEGRLRFLAGAKNHVKTYEVIDPEVWHESHS